MECVGNHVELLSGRLMTNTIHLAAETCVKVQNETKNLAIPTLTVFLY
jgi:hypothetical protein